ncbi:MAG TPA: hypothetical protein VHN36_09985 [Ilumatobacteraceae bacterium]|jgi:hypothetical protein|nr:hypothetical protein [Ilumatobacteraceae bacterium]
MTDESRIEEEYEPDDIDPDNPIASLADAKELPVEADPADWIDQQTVIPEDLEEDRPLGD